MRSFLSKSPAIAITVVATAIAVLLVASRDRPAPLQRPEKAWVVDVASAKRQNLAPTLELFGSVQSPQNARLSAGIDGLVVDVAVLDGETVEDEQPLVILDDRDVRLQSQQAEADLAEIEAKRSFARRRLTAARAALEKETELLELTETRARRAQELVEQGVLSQSDLDTTAENQKRQQLAVNQAQLTVEEVEIQLTELSAQAARARARRDQALLDLERTTVSAPFPGVISELAVSEGDRVRAGDQLMRLQNPATIEIRTQVPTRYAETVSAGLASGRPMAAKVDISGDMAPGRLVRLSGQTSAASGGVDSFIRFTEAPRGLRLGSTVRVLLELPPEENVTAVPAEAMYGRDRVYKLVDNRMKMVEVERVGERVQASGATEILVRSPLLTSNDWIVTTKLANAADGLLADPVVDSPSATDALSAGPVPQEDAQPTKR